jgi:hypothetical protein
MRRTLAGVAVSLLLLVSTVALGPGPRSSPFDVHIPVIFEGTRYEPAAFNQVRDAR